ncbi:MAG TPA: O-antigen ligase family protein [Steroidobacteraceae bacterium]|nr:O-antigen ligase family protein [Steroidobacteraceae bacterium]
MVFLYPLLNYLQPGDLWPFIATAKPMLLASLLSGLLLLRKGAKPDPALVATYFKQPALWWLGAFVAVNVISVFYSGIMSMVNELQFWDVYAIFVAISLFMLKDVQALRQYVWGTIVGSAFVIFYAIVAVAVHASTIVEGRAGAYGMYQNQNDYSFIVVMVMPFAYLYLRLYRRWWQRAFLIAVLIGGVVGVLLSLSRGGILALVLEAALLLWVTMRGGRRVVALAALAVIGTGVSIHQFAAREADQAGQYTLADSKDSRYELWRAARAVFEAHPILGVGSRRFREYARYYAPISHDNRGKVAHNTYLEVAADTGILGTLAFCLMLLGSLKPLWRARLSAATGDGLAETQVAGFVTLGCILFRATLDAKVYDWSFYFLVVIAIATSALASRATHAAPAAAEAATPPMAATGRPAIYRLR